MPLLRGANKDKFGSKKSSPLYLLNFRGGEGEDKVKIYAPHGTAKPGGERKPGINS